MLAIACRASVPRMFTPRRILPLSITARAETGHELVVAVERLGPPGSPHRLILQTGMVRLEIPPAEAQRIAGFIAGWWPTDA